MKRLTGPWIALSEIGLEDVYKVGEEVDVVGVTKERAGKVRSRGSAKVAYTRTAREDDKEETWETFVVMLGRRSDKLDRLDTTREQS